MIKYPALPLLLLFAACGDGVPDQPTYFEDVAPILRANCVRCHGADPTDVKIATFRLDRYVGGDEKALDVWDYASSDPAPIMSVAVNHESPAMPPDYSLTDRQRDILARWISQGAEKGEKIKTHPNHDPQIQLISPTGVATANQNLDTTFRAWDVDLDGLYVRLWAKDLTDPAEPPVTMGPLVGGGQRSIVADTGTLANNHSFEIYAVLDDGYFDTVDTLDQNKHEVTLIPELYVDHGLAGTAPRVEVLLPNGGETLIGKATIEWTASDPDPGDSLKFTVELINPAPKADGTFEVISTIAPAGTILPVPPAGSPYSINWDIPMTVPATDSTGASIPYKVRVTAQDALGRDELGNSKPNVRDDASDLPIFIAQAATTTYKWGDVASIFNTYCKDCHAGAGKTPAVDYFCLLEYNTAEANPLCEASDQGVFDVKDKVYQRMVVAKTMPPATQPKPSAADLAKVGSWILGGAPGGGGGGSTDAAPSFTWTAPDNTTVLDASASGMATLMWTVADDMALQSDLIEYAKVFGTGAGSNCAGETCPPTGATFKTITGAGGIVTGVSASRTFDWNAPTIKQGPNTVVDHGCFCVRGTVTDSANQSFTIGASRTTKF